MKRGWRDAGLMIPGPGGPAGTTTRVVLMPEGRSIVVDRGTSLAEAISRVAVFDLPCGGRGVCGRCAVKVDGQLSPPDPSERERLGDAALAAGFRLACRALIEGDVVVTLDAPAGAQFAGGKDTAATIPAVSLLRGSLQASHGGSRGAPLGEVPAPFEYSPCVRLAEVTVEAPSLASQKDDLSRLKTALGATFAGRAAQWPDRSRGSLEFGLSSLRSIPRALRAESGRVSVTAGLNRVVSVVPHVTGDGAPAPGPWGLALDVGTTTLAAYLLDLGWPGDAAARGPATVAALSTTNPQVSAGADLISRITYSSAKAGGVEEMRLLVLRGFNMLIARLAETAGITAGQIVAASVVGNTCMSSFFLGIDPEALGRSPYIPPVLEPLTYTAGDLGLGIHPEAEVWIAPGIAGYVGGDTVAVGTVVEALDPSGTWLAVDIGTNGEVLLKKGDRLLACSTAAGPAFEGGQIASGMRAAPGAIVDVRLSRGAGSPGVPDSVTVLGGGPPRGLCGSGLIRAVREMLLASVIDPRGRFSDRDVMASGYVLGRDAAGNPVQLTQRDVRQLQLAKAAIRTGIELLMERAGIATGDLDVVCLAGAFGNHIRPDDAVGLGLLPAVDVSRVRAIGNAAGTGAQLYLLSVEARRRAARIASTAEHVELSAMPSFQDAFVRNIEFPAPGVGGH
ncbi:MAG: DUF4445 domain-containing protein [Firmicutes bacterium]|nr:DUF4445 domain-containing protein [Bacillota bacterium]